jgi:hypothetical protein
MKARITCFHTLCAQYTTYCTYPNRVTAYFIPSAHDMRAQQRKRAKFPKSLLSLFFCSLERIRLALSFIVNISHQALALNSLNERAQRVLTNSANSRSLNVCLALHTHAARTVHACAFCVDAAQWNGSRGFHKKRNLSRMNRSSMQCRSLTRAPLCSRGCVVYCVSFSAYVCVSWSCKVFVFFLSCLFAKTPATCLCALCLLKCFSFRLLEHKKQKVVNVVFLFVSALSRFGARFFVGSFVWSFQAHMNSQQRRKRLRLIAAQWN